MPLSSREVRELATLLPGARPERKGMLCWGSALQSTPRGPKTMSTIREEVHKLADQLPPDASWDDVMYALYVRMKVAEGEQDTAEGRVLDQEEVERRTARWLAK